MTVIAHYLLNIVCTSTITKISPVLHFDVMFGRSYPHSLPPSAVPTFHYSQPFLALFQGPCFVIPPSSTFLNFLSLYLYLVPATPDPLSDVSWCPCSNSFPTISPPTTTPNPVDVPYSHIHLLPVWSLVGVCLHQQSNYGPFTAPTYTCLSGCNMALGLTQPLTEISTTIVSWGKRQPVCRADNLATFRC